MDINSSIKAKMRENLTNNLLSEEKNNPNSNQLFIIQNNRSNRKIMLDKIQKNISLNEKEFDPLKIKDRNYFMETVKKNNGYALKYADLSLKKDHDYILKDVKDNGGAFKNTDLDFKKDLDHTGVNNNNDFVGALKFANSSVLLEKDSEIGYEDIKNNSTALDNYEDLSLKDNELVLEDVKDNGYNNLFHYISSLRKDRDFILGDVKNNGCSLLYENSNFKNEIVLDDVKNNIYDLEYADLSLKKEIEICKTALEKNEKDLKKKDEKIKSLENKLKKEKPDSHTLLILKRELKSIQKELIEKKRKNRKFGE